MTTYMFTVTLQGEGETGEEAWENAVSAFEVDPGEPDEVKEIEVYTDEELAYLEHYLSDKH